MPGIITPPKSSIKGTSDTTDSNDDYDATNDIPELQTRDHEIDDDSDSDDDNDQQDHPNPLYNPTLVILVPHSIPRINKRKRTKANIKLQEIQRRIDTEMNEGCKLETTKKSQMDSMQGQKLAPKTGHMSASRKGLHEGARTGNLTEPQTPHNTRTRYENRHYEGQMGGLDDGNPDGKSDGTLDGSNEGIRTRPREGPQEKEV